MPDPHSTMAFGCLCVSWKGEVAPFQGRMGLVGVLGTGRSPGADGHHSSLHSRGLLSALLPPDSFMGGCRSCVQTGLSVKVNPQASLCLKEEYVTRSGFFSPCVSVHLDHEIGFLKQLHIRPGWVWTHCLSFPCLFGGEANLSLGECFPIVHLFPFGVLLWKFRAQ